MKLRFIGQDGSMGLLKGQAYNVELKAKGNFIWVTIPRFEFRHMVWGKWSCPYSSPQTFANNWEAVK